MSTIDYQRWVEVAERLLQRAGQTAQIRVYKSDRVDNITGDVDSDYLATEATVCSLPSVTAGFKTFDESFAFGLFRGQLKVFLVSPHRLRFSLRLGQFVVWEGVLWKIGGEDKNTGVMPISVIENTPVLYLLGCQLDSRDPATGSALDLSSADLTEFQGLEAL